MRDTIAIILLIGFLWLLIAPSNIGATFAKVRQGFISESPSVCAAPL